MKKKIFIIVGIVVLCLVILGLYTSYKDSARVRAGKEPKYTIKIISNGGNKVTYIGLGYKVIRYPGVSPKEPFDKSRGYKYGSWFMTYEIEEELDPRDVNDYIINYLENNKLPNFVFNYVDEDKKKVIVGLIDNSKENQEKFIKLVFTNCCGSKYIDTLYAQNVIEFVKSEKLEDFQKPYIIVEESSPSPVSSFDIYTDMEKYAVYTVPNIREIYYVDNEKISLKDYLKANDFKNVTSLLEFVDGFDDGGSEIYKSDKYNITVLTCHTLMGNNNVFIGNYDTKFDVSKLCHDM